MRVVRLITVEGFVVFDLDGARVSAGGTRLAPDVTEREVALLARAMTYKFAVLDAAIGGAKAGIRARPGQRADAVARFCDEIRPLVEEARFLTGPDLGTSEADFAPIRDRDAVPGVMAATVDGVAFEDLVTGYGVAAAADAALAGLDGRSVALEGFGKVGGGVAREVARRGGRVVAVSTLAGCVHRPDGLDVEALWAAREEYGDECVVRLGPPVHPVAALFDVAADVLVPGARAGVIDGRRAARLQVRAVVPAANVPYTSDGLQVLRERGIDAHADFVCNAGAVIGYRSSPAASPAAVLAETDERIRGLVDESARHPDGPFAGACARAERFLVTWHGEGPVPGAPLA